MPDPRRLLSMNLEIASITGSSLQQIPVPQNTVWQVSTILVSVIVYMPQYHKFDWRVNHIPNSVSGGEANRIQGETIVNGQPLLLLNINREFGNNLVMQPGDKLEMTYNIYLVGSTGEMSINVYGTEVAL
jgi:hypothetical protein